MAKKRESLVDGVGLEREARQAKLLRLWLEVRLLGVLEQCP